MSGQEEKEADNTELFYYDMKDVKKERKCVCAKERGKEGRERRAGRQLVQFLTSLRIFR